MLLDLVARCLAAEQQQQQEEQQEQQPPQGFLKYQELAIDSVFVRRGHPAAMDARPLWYPPLHKEDVQHYKQTVQEGLCDFFNQFWGLPQEEQEEEEEPRRLPRWRQHHRAQCWDRHDSDS